MDFLFFLAFLTLFDLPDFLDAALSVEGAAAGAGCTAGAAGAAGAVGAPVPWANTSEVASMLNTEASVFFMVLSLKLITVELPTKAVQPANIAG